MGEAAAGGKTMGVDLGERRIGIALSDSTGTLAFPFDTLERSGDPRRDRERMIGLVTDNAVGSVVVGLPLTLRGTRGRAAEAVEAEVSALRDDLAATGIAVYVFDERLTTVSAQSALAQAGKRGRRARAVVDQAAAAVLLQAWLDAR